MLETRASSAASGGGCRHGPARLASPYVEAPVPARLGRPDPGIVSEGLLNLQRTLDARIDHSTQALNTSLITGLTQLSTQLVSRVDNARLDGQMAMEERSQAVHRELQQQFETLRAHIQEGLTASRRELFGMVTALQQGVEQRLSDNITQHSTLFKDMAEKLGELRVTNERIVAISQDINQLSRILESPKLRGNLGEFELERMLSNVLPTAAVSHASPGWRGAGRCRDYARRRVVVYRQQVSARQLSPHGGARCRSGGTAAVASAVPRRYPTPCHRYRPQIHRAPDDVGFRPDVHPGGKCLL